MKNYLDCLAMSWNWFDNKPLVKRVWYTLELAWSLAKI